ncbi:polysaccharide biosynthesis/export family protein [Belliella kenyensis]|uniref:Polysaccharide biosynthesis/export family protein n=1 Tax=Belliella kenyensis TaxID=1472724 RepID=A0ABV8EIL7_9BACT|nr:polysaccharide biosynthesis/export family protein [Belliella kenyensis]MCH7401704.1 polysaccharide biosynthesis/export family protein [Belliella kenyensis]MDN3604204.1 polysaccharide biosynthesis/export family protein [Belliella kenyensis]
MKVGKTLWLYLILLLVGISCVPNKKVIYLQNLEGETPIAEGEMIYYEIPEYRLQYNDIIDVNIQTASDFLESGFNAKQQMSGNQAMVGQIANSGGDIYYMNGYTIDRNGMIKLPVIGEIKAKDLTIEEVRALIEQKVKSTYLRENSDLFVKVKLGGVRFSTLGEFRRPGKYVVLQDRMTIFEAIAHSGDLNIVAKRDEILLIRQYPEGSKLHRINLNDRHLIQSPFYFIQPNDQIYAEPRKIREIGAGENASQSLALVISSITAVALIINTITR